MVFDRGGFLTKLHTALANQREATRTGGYYGVIIGDVRGGGRHASYQAHVIARIPRDELRAVLIKAQHNVRSDRTHYELSLPRIMHEYIVLWQRLVSFKGNRSV